MVLIRVELCLTQPMHASPIVSRSYPLVYSHLCLVEAVAPPLVEWLILVLTSNGVELYAWTGALRVVCLALIRLPRLCHRAILYAVF